uniref:hypothetical protein n=1 Tax=Succinimonas sp. TaxID=1936151 RepID=UPI00386F2059
MSEVNMNTGNCPSLEPAYPQEVAKTSNRGDEVAITSVELMFAKLQNDLAIENREYAKDRIDAIKQKQQESKEI